MSVREGRHKMSTKDDKNVFFSLSQIQLNVQMAGSDSCQYTEINFLTGEVPARLK